MTCQDFTALVSRDPLAMTVAELGALWLHRRGCRSCREWLTAMSAGKQTSRSQSELVGLADKVVADPESGFKASIDDELRRRQQELTR